MKKLIYKLLARRYKGKARKYSEKSGVLRGTILYQIEHYNLSAPGSVWGEIVVENNRLREDSRKRVKRYVALARKYEEKANPDFFQREISDSDFEKMIREVREIKEREPVRILDID